MAPGRMLYEKIWDAHALPIGDGDEALLLVDLHMLHEVSSPQAFAGLRAAKRPVRRPERTLAVVDHNIPTTHQADGVVGIADPQARMQVHALLANTAEAGIETYALGDPRNGIVHVVGPEQGRTQPGMTIVCGDSHTSTHGAFGALAFGIGTSEVEHVLATGTLRARKSRTIRVRLDGAPAPGVGAKDYALALIARIGTAGGTGAVIEYAGTAVSALSMEGRMTLCNMTIEAGARAGLVAPDEKTIAYLRGRPGAPGPQQWDQAVAYWRSLRSDPDAHFDQEIAIDVGALAPMASWGTSPEESIPIDGRVPDPAGIADPVLRETAERALAYMALQPGQALAGLRIDRVFIGSCTNSRIEDLRAAAAIADGRKVAGHVNAMVVPGSGLVKQQAEAEGLDQIFRRAGFDWREPGCSMCVALNPDRLAPGERCASTSNRNFEGRQGRGGRTHLVSPAMAAAAAVSGALVDVRELLS